MRNGANEAKLKFYFVVYCSIVITWKIFSAPLFFVSQRRAARLSEPIAFSNIGAAQSRKSSLASPATSSIQQVDDEEKLCWLRASSLKRRKGRKRSQKSRLVIAFTCSTSGTKAIAAITMNSDEQLNLLRQASFPPKEFNEPEENFLLFRT
jgi:hypothetical protein